MKGAFFHQQLEYRIEVPKDGCLQGDSVPCTFFVKNHGPSLLALPDLRLDLALGDIKSVKNKAAVEESFEILSSATLTPDGEILPQQQLSFPWTFELDRNCAVTDKAQTLYFLYGSRSGVVGNLPLTVEGHAHAQLVLRSLETVFQFVFKGRKSSKGWLEAKFKPPASRRFKMLNELVLGMRFEGSTLNLRYVFNVKKFDTAGSGVGVKKGKTEVLQQLEESAYVIPGGFIKHEFLDSKIEEALSEVASGI